MLRVLAASPGVKTVDITGGAPEMSPAFCPLVRGARDLGLEVRPNPNPNPVPHPNPVPNPVPTLVLALAPAPAPTPTRVPAPALSR